jgi:hypothetical protein
MELLFLNMVFHLNELIIVIFTGLLSAGALTTVVRDFLRTISWSLSKLHVNAPSGQVYCKLNIVKKCMLIAVIPLSI